jgi:menaquinone-dependent protoporphyrinogen IX oxidase
MGKINGSEFISKNWNTLQNKKVVLFSTSGAEPNDPELQKIFANSVPEKIRSQVKYFPLSGACEYKKLSFLHKVLSFLGSLFQKNPIKKYEMRHGFNRVKKENINPIVVHIQTLLMRNITIP